MCYSFLIQEHDAIKYIVNMWENVCLCSNICYHFAKDIVFLYHDIATICVYHVYHEILYHNLSSIMIIMASLTRITKNYD